MSRIKLACRAAVALVAVTGLAGPVAAAQQALRFDVVQDATSAPPYPTLPRLLYAVSAGTEVVTPVQNVELSLEGVSGGCDASFPADLVGTDSGGGPGATGTSAQADVFWDTESGDTLPKKGCVFEARLDVEEHPDNDVSPVVISTDLIQQDEQSFLLFAIATFQGGGSSLLEATFTVPAGQMVAISKPSLDEQVENAVFVSWQLKSTGGVDPASPFVSVDLEGVYDPAALIPMPRLKINFGDGGFETLADAIDALADGGVLNIPSGEFSEQVEITGKDVHIHGAGKGKTKLMNPGGPNKGVLNYKDGGGGSVKDVDCYGNSGNCIDGDGAGSLFVTDLRALGGLAGITGNYSRLRLGDAQISGMFEFAVLLNKVGSAGVEIGDSILSQGSFGIAIINAEGLNPPVPTLPDGTIDIHDVSTDDTDLGGIVIVGDFRPIDIERVFVTDSGAQGIGLYNTGKARIADSTVFGIVEREFMVGGESFTIADGIVAVDSGPLAIIDDLVGACQRTGLYFKDTTGVIQDTRSGTILPNDRFGLVLVDGAVNGMDWQSNGNQYAGEEQDVLTEGALGVPQPPSLPE